jgi:predicted ATPase
MAINLLAMADKFILSMENFGPIRKSELSLRPLTIFIGKNNTGKSYSTLLIKAIYDMIVGPAMGHVPDEYLTFRFLTLRQIEELQRIEEQIIEKESMRKGAEKGNLELMQFLKNNAFPKIQEEFNNYLKKKLSNGIKKELPRFFGGTTLGQIIQWGADYARIILTTDSLNFDVKISKNGDVEFSSFSFNLQPVFDRILQRLQNNRTRGSSRKPFHTVPLYIVIAEELAGELAEPLSPGGKQLYYLPASRAGVMQSHRVLAATLVAGAPFLTIRGMSLPPLSPANSEFISKLLQIPDLQRRFRAHKAGKEDEISKIADKLEKDTIGGRIMVKEVQPQHADFVYVDNGHEISILQAASSVGEISPLVLFLRYYVSKKDLLIIEEPEAHLHPAAIRELAKILARLVNAGVHIILTTHSDYLLSKLSNLIVASKVQRNKRTKLDIDDKEALDPEKCTVYLFKQPDEGTLTEEVRPSQEGISITEFNTISEEIYDENVYLSYALDR